MGIKFSNNGSTTLSEDITAAETDIDVSATASFPTLGAGDYFYATLIAQDGTREVIKVSSLAGSTYTVVRAQDDTGVTPDVTGYAFSTGDRFQLRLPKIVLEDFRNDIDTNATDLAGTTNAGTVPAPSGTNMFFYQAAAPTNWTIYSTVEDCLLAVAGGSQAYNVAGGTGAEAGSWTQSNHVHGMNSHTHGYAHTHGQAAHIHSMPTHWHSLSAHTHTGPSHTHTGPSHNHKFYDYISNSDPSKVWNSSGTAFELDWDHENGNAFVLSVQGADGRAMSSDFYTANDGTDVTGSSGTGASGAPSKDYTNTKDPGDTNPTDAGSTDSQSTSTTDAAAGDTEASAPVSTDRPLAAVGILATKD